MEIVVNPLMSFDLFFTSTSFNIFLFFNTIFLCGFLSNILLSLVHLETHHEFHFDIFLSFHFFTR